MRYLLIPLLLAACGGDETVSGQVDPDLTFALSTLDGTAFPARATIAFPGEGKVLGQAPCNRWSARQTAPYPWVEITGILSTKATCPDQPSEDAFFDALRQMGRIEAVGRVVIFSNDAGREMVFRAE
ncbi:META domain-containing protein [Oceaniglobus indicus]|uniref:META domain-containing protein n=1 Tax=Oceaniglobus indicus TaxID=2047749 RepID=UPI000C1874CF|nr:META domain-containing protein [Oceaniglobus indicus]